VPHFDLLVFFSYKYAVVYKCRNNNTVDKMKLIDGIVKLVGNEGHSVNLDNPEIVILIEIFKVHRHSIQSLLSLSLSLSLTLKLNCRCVSFCVFSQRVALPLWEIFTLFIDSILTSKQKVPILNDEHIIYWSCEWNRRESEVYVFRRCKSHLLSRKKVTN
jgi:hypothetical protein